MGKRRVNLISPIGVKILKDNNLPSLKYFGKIVAWNQ